MKGDVFAFYVEAINKQTSLDSDVSAPFILASVPATPTNAPGVVSDLTDETQVTVSYESISDDGGSDILSYELQMGDEKQLNNFVTVSGVDPTSLSLQFTVTRNIVKGNYGMIKTLALSSISKLAKSYDEFLLLDSNHLLLLRLLLCI